MLQTIMLTSMLLVWTTLYPAGTTPDTNLDLTKHWDTSMHPIPFTTRMDLITSALEDAIQKFPTQIYSAQQIFDKIFPWVQAHTQSRYPNCAHKSNYDALPPLPATMRHLIPIQKLFQLYTVIDFVARVAAYEQNPQKSQYTPQQAASHFDFLTKFPNGATIITPLKTLLVIDQFTQGKKLKMGFIFAKNAKISMLQHLMGLYYGYYLIPAAHDFTGCEHWEEREGRQKNVLECLVVYAARGTLQSAFLAEQLLAACSPHSLPHNRSHMQQWAIDLLKTIPKIASNPQQYWQKIGCPGSLNQHPHMLVFLTIMGYYNAMHEYPEQYALQDFHKMVSVNKGKKWLDLIALFKPYNLSNEKAYQTLLAIPLLPTSTINCATSLRECRQQWCRPFLWPILQKFLSLDEVERILNNIILEAIKALAPTVTEKPDHERISLKSQSDAVEAWAIVCDGRICAPIMCCTIPGQHARKRILIIVPPLENVRKVAGLLATISTISSAQLTAHFINGFLENNTVETTLSFFNKFAQSLHQQYYPAISKYQKFQPTCAPIEMTSAL